VPPGADDDQEPDMSDDQTPAPAEPTDVTAGVVTDGAYTLFVADFADPDTAFEAYESLKAVEDGRTVSVEGVLVVRAAEDGTIEVQKVTDHSTTSGLKWGVVGGVVLGVLFPPSIIGSAVVAGAAGAAIGKAREVHHRSELAKDLEGAIEPNHSGILALVSDPSVVAIRKALDKADAIVEKAVDKAVAADIKAAAEEAEQGGRSDDTKPAG
jgi:uncharacterized membrane protein